MRGTASGAPRAGLSFGEARPARPRPPGRAAPLIRQPHLSRQQVQWPSSPRSSVQLAVSASRAALRTVAGAIGSADPPPAADSQEFGASEENGAGQEPVVIVVPAGHFAGNSA